MCGRARLSSDVSEIKLAFSIPPERPAPNIAPSWNVAPTDPLPIVHYDAKAGARDLEVMRWGLIPYWAKDIKIGFSTINARAGGRHEARLPRGVPAPALPGAGRQFLRMEKDRHRQAALRDRAGRPAAGLWRPSCRRSLPAACSSSAAWRFSLARLPTKHEKGCADEQFAKRPRAEQGSREPLQKSSANDIVCTGWVGAQRVGAMRQLTLGDGGV